MATTNNLQKAIMTTNGTYNGVTTYAPLSVVTYSGSSYVSKTTVTGITPGVTTGWGTYWQLLSSKGDAGPGRSITSITLSTSVGNVDTYTILYSDATTTTFTVTNGEGIATTVAVSLSSTTTGTEGTVGAWYGAIAPYTQVVSVTGAVAEGVEPIIRPAMASTASQYAAYKAADLNVSAIGADTVTVTAYGTRPSISVPILVYLFT